MKKNYFLLSLLLLFGLMSCENGPLPGEEPEVSERLIANGGNRVYAGVTGSGMNVQVFNPPLEVPVVWDQDHLYGYGNLQVDLDGQSPMDAYIYLIIVDSSNWSLLQGVPPNPAPNCLIWGNPDWYFHEIPLTYTGGWGREETGYFSPMLANGDIVNSSANDFPSRTGRLWIKDYSNSPPPTGFWYTAPSIGYLGFVKKGRRLWDRRYGWIEIDNSDRTNPKILRIAIEAP